MADNLSQINIEISEKDKKESAIIFNHYGLDITTEIKLYLKEVQRTKSIPLKLQPVTELKTTIQEACNREYVGSYDSIEEFEAAMNNDA